MHLIHFPINFTIYTEREGCYDKDIYKSNIILHISRLLFDVSDPFTPQIGGSIFAIHNKVRSVGGSRLRTNTGVYTRLAAAMLLPLAAYLLLGGTELDKSIKAPHEHFYIVSLVSLF